MDEDRELAPDQRAKFSEDQYQLQGILPSLMLPAMGKLLNIATLVVELAWLLADFLGIGKV